MVEKQRSAHDEDNSDLLTEDNLQLTADLDEHSIKKHLTTISRTNPQQLPATVQAVREKWAFMVGGWAERGRLDYLRTLLLQMDVSHDILVRCLSMEDQWETHQEKKARRKERTRAHVYTLEANAEAAELNARIEEARARQAEARGKREDLEHPPTPPRELTAEERRKQRLKEAEDEISRLIVRRDQVLAEHLTGRKFEGLSAAEQEEYRADENMYNDRIRRAKEKRVQFE